MQIKATIKVINAPVEGVSKTSGNAWKRQEIVIGWDEPYGSEGRSREQLISVKLAGRSVERFEELGFKPGDQITGNLDFGTRSYNNKVYNDIALYIE